jgi:hypothetical protein
MNSHVISADLGSSTGTDFVKADAASLASHMNRCASAQGRFFTLKTSLQGFRDLLSGRIVTAAACIMIAAVLVALA